MKLPLLLRRRQQELRPRRERVAERPPRVVVAHGDERLDGEGPQRLRRRHGAHGRRPPAREWEDVWAHINGHVDVIQKLKSTYKQFGLLNDFKFDTCKKKELNKIPG